MKKIFLNTMLFASLAFVPACNDTTDSVASSHTREEISIIPMPVQLQEKNGSFAINKETKIVVQQGNEEAMRIGKMLAEKFQKAAGLEIAVTGVNDNGSNNTIYFTTSAANDSLGNEGYQLSVNNNSVIVRAREPAGLFYECKLLLNCFRQK